MNYKHLSQIERYEIASLMKAKHSITQIASLVGRHKSTISRELRGNATLGATVQSKPANWRLNAPSRSQAVCQ
jgi:IS30 family transposase